MAKLAKTCEILVMKCELLELEKRSIEEKLGHVTEIASTASSLVQKLDEALESHDAVLAETRAERDELRAALDSTDRVVQSSTGANDGGGEDGARFRALIARSEALEAGLVDLERRAAAAQSSSARDRASLESALARQRQLESEKRRLESAARTLRAENAALSSAPFTGVGASPDQIARLRPARQGARVRQSRDRVPASGAHRRGSHGESRGERR